LKKAAVWVDPKVPVNVVKMDPADNKFLECALACQADFLITGNTKHFSFKEFHQTKVVGPGEFLELIGEITLS
ncbi:MAG: PIN domain-containing protein, partial [Syntrophales bacterium]|nr:PIN domain-containing protein [Syntrophales bacterium]